MLHYLFTHLKKLEITHQAFSSKKMMLRHTAFLHIVWESWTRLCNLSGLQCIAYKFKHLKADIKLWNKVDFGNIFQSFVLNANYYKRRFIRNSNHGFASLKKMIVTQCSLMLKAPTLCTRRWLFRGRIISTLWFSLRVVYLSLTLVHLYTLANQKLLYLLLL